MPGGPAAPGGSAGAILVTRSLRISAASLSVARRLRKAATLPSISSHSRLTWLLEMPLIPIACTSASTERVDSLVWSRDGRRLLSAGGASVRVWSMPAGTLEQRIDHGDARVIAASFAGDGRILSNSTDQLWMWDLATGKEVRRFDDPAGRWRVELDRAGTRVLSTTRNSEGKIWRLSDGVVTAELMGHVAQVPAGAWRADGKLVATGSYDGTARVWDPATGDLLLVLDHAGERVMSVVFSPDGKQLLTTTSVGSVTLWDLPLEPPAQADMAGILRCRVPYVVEENRVRQRQRDLSACAPAPASR